MSRVPLDRPRSNIGPRAVHLSPCAAANPARCEVDFDLLKRRLGPGYLKSLARRIGVPHGTAKKWFLGQTRPGYERRLSIASAYAELLAPAREPTRSLRARSHPARPEWAHPSPTP